MEELVKRIKIKFKSISPVLFDQYVDTERIEGETPLQFENRTWKDRSHYNEGGNVIISGFLLKTTLEPAAKLLGKRIGGGKKGMGLSHYIRLIQVEGDIVTNTTRDTVVGRKSFVSSNGKQDGGKVSRTYPKIQKWEGVLTICYPTIADALNEEIVMEHLQVAGEFVGIGHWRPGAPSCGTFGRFSVEKVE